MDTSNIRKGLKFLVDDQPYVVLDFQFVKPGKGAAFTRVKIRNLLSGAVQDRVYKDGEKLAPADVEECSVQYLHAESQNFVFGDARTGEQFTIQGGKIGDDSRWLSPGLVVDMMTFRGEPIAVNLPPSVVLQIVSSEPGAQGDTTRGATKPATLSTGAVVHVPLFVQVGEWVKVNTEDGKYLEQVRR